MTPVGKLVIARPGTTRNEAEQIFREHKIEKLPVVDKDGTLRGLITAKALVNEAEYPHSCRDRRGRLLVGAAVGVKQGDRDRVKELVSAGADVIVVDIAHGHAEQVLDMTRYIKENFSVEVISGNVATSRGVRDLVRAGADAVKVGIGAGSVCITRIVAGAGYPQFSAVANCAAEARKLRIPIIADGNIRAAGDVAKAIGGGADSVMVGSLLAGTDESPGMLITRNDKKYKVTRGMASLGASMARKLKNGADEKVLEELREYVAEGVEALVPYRGKAEEILSQLVRGLQSGMSYTGANSILQMQNKAKFVQVTQAGIRESLPHDVEIL
jgi:IMP dehydrogenase